MSEILPSFIYIGYKDNESRLVLNANPYIQRSEESYVHIHKNLFSIIV